MNRPASQAVGAWWLAAALIVSVASAWPAAGADEPAWPARVAVNDHDLRRALSAAVHAISHTLDPAGLPYFECHALERPRLAFNPQFSAANVAGRSLYALLRARAVGIEVDPAIVAQYRQVVLESYRLTRAMPGNPETPGASYNRYHWSNTGAGLRGLVGLVEFENDDTARRYADEAFQLLRMHLVEEGFNWRRYARLTQLDQLDPKFDAARWPETEETVARSGGFILWAAAEYHRLTGSADALAVARGIADLHVRHAAPADGRLAGYDHVFEPAAEMNALARLALITRDIHYMRRARARYDVGVRAIRSANGWMPENLAFRADVGEINNTAELIETALSLARWGWPQYYQDAERFMRGHLLPAQLLDVSVIPAAADEPPDSELPFAERIRGVWGFPAPYGHVATRNSYLRGAFHLDIVSGGAVGVAEVWKHCVERTTDSQTVNMWFDYEDELIRVREPYAHDGSLSIVMRAPGTLRVRLPHWLDPGSLRVTVSDEPIAFEVAERMLVIRSAPAEREIRVDCAIPYRAERETLNDRSFDLLWHGDRLVATSSMGAPLRFFPELSTDAPPTDARRERLEATRNWLETLGAERLFLHLPLDADQLGSIGQLLESHGVQPAPDRLGNAGGAAWFDGVQSRMRVALPYFPEREFTLSLWVKPDPQQPEPPREGRIVSAWAEVLDDPVRVSFSRDGLSAGVENGRIWRTDAFPLSADRWTHAAVVRTDYDLRLFIDGALVDSVRIHHPPDPIHTRAQDLGIGWNPNHAPDGEFFRGAVDDLRIYGRALGEDEIRRLAAPPDAFP